jgi:uncharacterized protein
VRIVLDTNIFVSALISSKSSPAGLLDFWRNGRFELWVHEILLDEIRDVTSRAGLRPIIKRYEVGAIVNRLRLSGCIAKKLPDVQRSPDPRDDFLLALCEAASADWLVTGDKDDLLALERHGITRIVTAREMLDMLGSRR